MISMTRQQQGDFNRCCDFLARMIEKYGDSIELGTAQKVLRNTLLAMLPVTYRHIWNFKVLTKLMPVHTSTFP